MSTEREEHAGLPRLMLIYLHEHEPGLLVSKKPYDTWRDVQAEYEDYVTSLEMTVDGILAFVKGDCHLDDNQVAHLREKLNAFIASDKEVISFPDV